MVGLQCHPGCFDAIVSKMLTIYDAGFGVSGSRENDMPQLDSISKATCGPGFQLREVLCPVFALSPIAYGDICKRKTLIALQDRPDCMFVSECIRYVHSFHFGLVYKAGACDGEGPASVQACAKP